MKKTCHIHVKKMLNIQISTAFSSCGITVDLKHVMTPDFSFQSAECSSVWRHSHRHVKTQQHGPLQEDIGAIQC